MQLRAFKGTLEAIAIAAEATLLKAEGQIDRAKSECEYVLEFWKSANRPHLAATFAIALPEMSGEPRFIEYVESIAKRNPKGEVAIRLRQFLARHP